MDTPDATSEVAWLRWVHGEIVRVEAHWTAQIQDQQQRISTILAVNGVLLGFLAGAGFLSGSMPAGTLAAGLFLASLVLLCIAMIAGLLALTPLTRIAKGESSWLQVPERWSAGSSFDSAPLRARCEEGVANQGEARHADTLHRRRLAMYVQLTLLASALVVLIAALIAFGVRAR